MRGYIDLTGQRFGEWTVLPSPPIIKGAAGIHWQCQCVCGEQKLVRGLSLRQGRSSSCGCVKKRVINLAGKIFGRLTVISFSHISRGGLGHACWNCVCECGTEKTIAGNHLRDGNTVSCGCFAREQISNANRTHGHGHESPTYRSWRSMMSRCNNPKSNNYKYWGGRGIIVCERWFSFENFLADMGVRPVGMTLDRYPNKDGNYELKNCRWAGPTMQVRNRRMTAIPTDVALHGFLSFGC
jgi:hypothetical protein